MFTLCLSGIYECERNNDSLDDFLDRMLLRAYE